MPLSLIRKSFIQDLSKNKGNEIKPDGEIEN